MSITIDDVSLVYAKGTPFETKAVDHISLEINQGEFLGVIGHTGSGKTTLIQMIAGLMKPDSGTIALNGDDINDKDFDRRLLRKSVGVVFQYPEYQLFEETVYKDIAFAPKKAGLDEAAQDKAVKKACELLDIDFEAIKDKSPFELSGGQKRKVAIAGVLAVDPDILILDEPVAGLDPQGRKALMELITNLNNNGKTVIMITHSMDDLALYAKRVLVMKSGGMVYDDTPEAVFAHPEELIEMDLDIPEASKIVMALNQKEKHIPKTIITINQLFDYLMVRMGDHINGAAK